MRVLVACDSFKGTMTAPRACDAVAAGLRGALGEGVGIRQCPASDGGEGFAELVNRAAAGKWREAEVTGPRGERFTAGFGLLTAGPGDGGSVAVADAATACGLALVPAEDRDPERLSSRGVGELIAAAVGAGARTVMLGVGGTATVDGGVGALVAMGGRLLDARGRELEPVGASLDAIDRVAVAPGSVLERFREGPLGLRVAADVRSPLLGPRGAAGVFGPQKGATPDAVERLENGLERVASRLGCAEMAGMPGMGAAGGMAFGLSAVARASVEPGFAVFAGAARLGSLVSWADAVVTGEGVADGTSLEGKVVGGLIELVSGSGRPVAIVAGRSSEGVGWPAGVRVFAATADGGIAAAEQIASAACRAGRWLASG